MMERCTVQLSAEDRFDRLRRIDWWEQDRLRSAKILVLGAGALGNEILKNLALLGIGNIFVADLDRIEESNLSRSILFRDQDVGQSKAHVAAQAVKVIYPDINVHWFHGDVIYELGLGVYDWADLVLAGMDNREARLWINRCCWKTGTPWIDGATETLQGVVRVFVPPGGACYECTLSAEEWHLLNERRGCAGLRREDIQAGRVPTTPITASVIAAIQCQEAVKLLHGREVLAGKGLVFNGISNDSYIIAYNMSEDCNTHDTREEIVRLNRTAGNTTLSDLIDLAREHLGTGASLELNHDVLTAFHCPRCSRSDAVFRPRGAVPERQSRCPGCQQERRTESTQTISGSELFLGRTLASLGVPPFDIVAARNGLRRLGFLLAGDAPTVLGPLHGSNPTTEGAS